MTYPDGRTVGVALLKAVGIENTRILDVQLNSKGDQIVTATIVRALNSDELVLFAKELEAATIESEKAAEASRI